MAVTGTVYSAVSKDNNDFAYVDMGFIAFKADHARKSGIVYDLKDVPALMNKLQRAVDKRIFIDQKWIDTYRNDNRPHIQMSVKAREKDIAKARNQTFGIVKITIEEVDPSLY